MCAACALGGGGGWYPRLAPAGVRLRPADGAAWAWLEPYPGPPPGPGAASMSLAFITALQQLPPRERAALVLSDVLDFDAAEMAEILECEPAELDDLLLRARAGIGGALPQPPMDEEAVLSRFTGAFQRGDVSGMTALLARDAWLRMRPIPVEYQGRRLPGTSSLPSPSPAARPATVWSPPGPTASPPSVATCGIPWPGSITRAGSSC